MIKVINFSYTPPEDATVINTTSRSVGWSKGLSPFFLGPVDLYNGFTAENVENGWQFSKIFSGYLSDDGSVGEEYFSWAKKGWADKRAQRYPMGRGAKPLFSYWDGETFEYVAARKKIYIPLYSNAVRNTSAFAKLKEVYEKEEDIMLMDFDAHNLNRKSFEYDDLWNNSHIKVGHAYVLAMMLEGIL